MLETRPYLRPAYFDVHESKGESLLNRGVYSAAGS